MGTSGFRGVDVQGVGRAHERAEVSLAVLIVVFWLSPTCELSHGLQVCRSWRELFQNIGVQYRR